MFCSADAHISAGPGGNDGLPDFLTDDILDPGNLPDTLWSSDGSSVRVSAVLGLDALSMDFDPPLIEPNSKVFVLDTRATVLIGEALQITFNLAPSLPLPVSAQTGWVYFRAQDPARNDSVRMFLLMTS